MGELSKRLMEMDESQDLAQENSKTAAEVARNNELLAHEAAAKAVEKCLADAKVEQEKIQKVYVSRLNDAKRDLQRKIDSAERERDAALKEVHEWKERAALAERRLKEDAE